MSCSSLRAAKQPALSSWFPYQERRPDPSELGEWFGDGEIKNIGIVCGKVSDNLVVLDFDSEEAYEHFMHVKGEGGYVVAPPSLHPNGKKYKFINSPRQIANVGDFDAFEKICHDLGADIHLFVAAQKLGGRVISYTEKAEQAPITSTPKNDGAHWIVEALQGVLEGERDDASSYLRRRQKLGTSTQSEPVPL